MDSGIVRNALTFNLLGDREARLLYQAARDVQAKVAADHGAPSVPSQRPNGRPTKRSIEDQQAILKAWDAFVAECCRAGTRPLIGEFTAKVGIPLRSFSEMRRSRPRIWGWK